jgi:hypothetical protein
MMTMTKQQHWNRTLQSEELRGAAAAAAAAVLSCSRMQEQIQKPQAVVE